MSAANHVVTERREALDGQYGDHTIKRRGGRNPPAGRAEIVVSVSLDPKWYTVAEVARMLGYGETKVRMLIIAGDLRSLKDGRSRRVLPQWVDEYVEMRAAQADDQRFL